MAFQQILSRQRRLKIRHAFADWYRQFARGERGKAAERVNMRTDQCGHACDGRVVPPPRALKALFLETGNPVFLLSADEKSAYRKNGTTSEVPDSDGWPDLEPTEAQVTTVPPPEHPPEKCTNSDEPMDLDLLIEMVRITANEVRNFSRLTPTDARRQAARKRLVAETMKLFHGLTELQLEFPEAFRDLLEQLEVAGMITIK